MTELEDAKRRLAEIRAKYTRPEAADYLRLLVAAWERGSGIYGLFREMGRKTMKMEYPLQLNNVAPGAGYVRMTDLGTLPNGLPEGSHTGGPWFHPDAPNAIYKPLDCLPYLNCTVRCATAEDEALEAAQGLCGFGVGDAVEQNGRRWLVRNRAYVVRRGGDADPRSLSIKQVLNLEADIKAFNLRGWIINDHLNVAIDAANYELFVLDLSSAQRMSVRHFCHDEDKWMTWLQWMGFDAIYNLRAAAKNIVYGRDGIVTALTKPEDLTYTHVYGSYNRPFSFTWADTVDAKLIHGRDGMHTWVVTKQPLPDDYCARYELRFAWSPWY